MHPLLYKNIIDSVHADFFLIHLCELSSVVRIVKFITNADIVSIHDYTTIKIKP